MVDVANLIEPANRPEGTFLSDYVSGAMKAGDRKEKIDRLKVLEGYDRGILTNARCMTFSALLTRSRMVQIISR